MTYRQDCYDTYYYEVAQVEEEYADGEITAEQRLMYLENLYNNLQSDLEDC